MGVTTDEDKVVAVATVNRPGERRSSSGLDELREQAWRELGDAARSRYEAYGEATRKFVIEQPHYHLAMLGVRRSYTGQGFARRLLDVLHERSYDDRESRGVTLNTEDPRNVPLYQHFGYRVIGQARVSDELQTWAFYRDDPRVTWSVQRAPQRLDSPGVIAAGGGIGSAGSGRSTRDK